MRIARYATRYADRFTIVVDRVGEPVRIAGKRREFLDMALLPDDGLSL
jgi:hypothetical protein